MRAMRYCFNRKIANKERLTNNFTSQWTRLANGLTLQMFLSMRNLSQHLLLDVIGMSAGSARMAIWKGSLESIFALRGSLP